MLPGLRRLLQGKGPPFSGARGCGVRGTGWGSKASPRTPPPGAPLCSEVPGTRDRGGSRAVRVPRSGAVPGSTCSGGRGGLWPAGEAPTQQVGVCARRPVPQHFAVTRDGGASRARTDCEEEGAPTRKLGSLWKVPEKGPGTDRRGGVTGVWRVEEGDSRRWKEASGWGPEVCEIGWGPAGELEMGGLDPSELEGGEEKAETKARDPPAGRMWGGSE